MLQVLKTQNADCNLYAGATVLSHTVVTGSLVQIVLRLGDGTKNLCGTGGDYTVVVTVGGQTIQPSPALWNFSTAVRSSIILPPMSVGAGLAVTVAVTSPNAADTDVDVTAVLNDIQPVLGDASGYVTLAAAGLDQIPVTAPSGLASTFRQMVVQLWRRHFSKVVKTATAIETYAANGTTKITTQAISDDGATQTLGAAESA